MSKKSPIALFGTKKVINYSRDHSIDEGLEYVTTWNSAMLQTVVIATFTQQLIGYWNQCH